MITTITQLNPMEFAPKDGHTYVMLFIKSGYTTTPLRVEVATYDKEFRPRQPWVNYANDSIFDAGGDEADIVGWLPVPTPLIVAPYKAPYRQEYDGTRPEDQG